MNRRFLVTGGAGMIGSNLVKKLTRLGNEVVVVDNLWRGRLEYLNDIEGKPIIDIGNRFYKYDLSEPGVLDEILVDIDYVVHLADVVAGINYVFDNQSSIFRQNILINSNTIASVRKSDIEGFLYIGTACSFPKELQNSIDSNTLHETDLYPANPESAYGWSKLMGQYETDLLCKETEIKTATLMLHNVYGTPCDYSPERSQVIPALMRKAINYPDEDFIVWGSGQQGRAFIHIDDVINGIMLTLEKGWGRGSIQLGPSICTPIRDIARKIVDISGKDINVVYDTSKPEGDKARCADFSKAFSVLGWQPLINLEDGLENQYKWIEDRIIENK